MAAGSSLCMNKLQIECCVPGSLSSSENTADKFTKIARENLSQSLEDVLKPLENTDEKIVLIKSLELEFDIDLLLTRQQISQVWANKIKSTLLQVMSGKVTSNIVIFENDISYIKSVLLDIVRGRASQLWYYRRFNGLWALPVSAAIRTLLLDKPEQGLVVLNAMQSFELLELIDALNEQDTKNLIARFFEKNKQVNVTAGDINYFIASVRSTYNFVFSLFNREYHQTLLLACLAIKTQESYNLSVTIKCARYLTLLLQLKNEYPDSFQHISKLLTGSRHSELKNMLGVRRISSMLSLLKLDAELIKYLVELISLGSSVDNKIFPQGDEDTRYTLFGNAFLLLPQIQQLPLSIFHQWKPLGKQPASSIMQFLALCLCQGVDKFVMAFGDPLLRDLCGIGSDIKLSGLVPWLNNQITTQQITDFHQEFKGYVASDAQPLLCFEWKFADKYITAYSDTQKGCWFYLAIDEEKASIERVPKTQRGEKLKTVKADFAVLSPHNRWQLSNEASACLCLLAQITLKSFAFRLPGFSQSTVKYLLQNFLSMSATLVAKEDRIVAYISKVPMSIILNMNGMNRSSLYLHDYDHREIKLIESG